jgi:hypothetical protein
MDCVYRKIYTAGLVTTSACIFCGRKASPPLRGMCGIPESAGFGPGTALKMLLAGWPFFIRVSEGCPCVRHAEEMDQRGSDWCEQNIDTIVGWLGDEARRRSLPFLDAAGALLVKRAIAKSRRSRRE